MFLNMAFASDPRQPLEKIVLRGTSSMDWVLTVVPRINDGWIIVAETLVFGIPVACSYSENPKQKELRLRTFNYKIRTKWTIRPYESRSTDIEQTPDFRMWPGVEWIEQIIVNMLDSLLVN